MKFLKALFRFYINASIHVALAVVALTVFTCIQFQIPIDYKLLCFIFLSSITGYNFVKYAPIAKLHHRSLTQHLRQIQIFSFVVFFGLVACIFYMSLKVIIVCIILGIITLLYAIPIGRKNLREIALLKVFFIAFIWAVTTYILPFLNDSFPRINLNNIFSFQFFERMLWVIFLMIPFEIRDLKFDTKYLKTIVSTFGIRPVKIASFIILILLCVQKLYVLNSDFVWVYLSIYLSLMLAISFAKPVQKPYYCSFFVEALPIFWLTMYFVLT